MLIAFSSALVIVIAFSFPREDMAGAILSSPEIKYFVKEKSSSLVNDVLLVTPVEEATQERTLVLLDVPFTSQAPNGQWSNPRFQDGCEEASILMAVRWYTKETIDPEKASDDILEISQKGEKLFGFFEDTSARDTAEFLRQYIPNSSIRVEYDITVEDIKQELKKENLVLVPAQGQRLKNPNFTSPGPERHMLVIRGFDDTTNEFITNDPGTRNGEAYRYAYDVLINAVLDYPSGKHRAQTREQKAMIVVDRL